MLVKEYKLFKKEDGVPEIKVKREFLYEKDSVETPEALYDLMQKMFNMGKLFVEHNYLIVYDLSRVLIGIVELAHGDTNKVSIPVKEMFICSLLLGAHEIVTIHNHPNNIVEPSLEDIKVKDMIKEICELLNIRYLDNMIITRDTYFSFTDEELI